jgi:Tol biopolymer transport system component
MALTLAASLAAGEADKTPASDRETPTATSLSATPIPAKVEVKLPAISKEVIYFCERLNGRLAICRIDADGQNRAYFSSSHFAFLPSPQGQDPEDDWSPCPSPDGSLVAFFSNRSGQNNLWIMDANGNSLKAVTHSDTDITSMDDLSRWTIGFSPDSKRLAFIGHAQLWAYTLSDETLNSLNADRPVRSLAWSRDGKSLAYVRGRSLCVDRLNGATTVLVQDRIDGMGLAWLKDNTLLYNQRGVWSVETGRKTSKLVATSLVKTCGLSLATDSSSLCFLGLSPDHASEVFTSTPDGKTAQLTDGGADDCFYSQDGKRIFFMRHGQLWSIGTDSRAVKPLVYATVFCPMDGIARLQEVR